MLLKGERAAAVDEGVKTECEEETCFSDIETQVKDHRASSQQAEGW